ncbi:MAG: insulinase family protein, partial [Bacteroidales bacterium]
LKKDYPTILTAFIGTQADKTIDAVNIYLELLKNMPEKTERIDNLRESLIQSAITSRPRFRRMSMSSRLWELRGFKDDANKVKLAQFESLDFNEILDFYKESIQNKPYVICVVGDKNTIDIESLKSFGEFIELQEEEIYTN